MAGDGKGDMPQHNPTPSSFSRWMTGVIATLLAALVIALWNGNARLAVVENNTSNIKEAFGQTLADHELRVRRLERMVQDRNRSRNGVPNEFQ